MMSEKMLDVEKNATDATDASNASDSTDSTDATKTTKKNKKNDDPKKKEFAKYKRAKAKPFNLFCVMSGLLLLLSNFVLSGLFFSLPDYVSVVLLDQNLYSIGYDRYDSICYSTGNGYVLVFAAVLAGLILISFLIAIIKSYLKAKKNKPVDYVEPVLDSAGKKKRRKLKGLKFLAISLVPTILGIGATYLLISGAYEKAVKEQENLNYEKSNAIFMTLWDYKDSKDKIIDITKEMALSRTYLATIDRATKKVNVEWFKDSVKHNINVSKWENVVQIDCGQTVKWDNGTKYTDYIVGVTEDGDVLVSGNNKKIKSAVKKWNDIVDVSAQDDFLIGLKKDGTVVSVGNNDEGQREVKDWKDIVAIETDETSTTGIKANGEVVCTQEKIADEDEKVEGSSAEQMFSYYYDVKKAGETSVVLTNSGYFSVSDNYFSPEIPENWEIDKKIVAIEVSNDGTCVCLVYSDGTTSIHDGYVGASYSGSYGSSYSSSSSSGSYGSSYSSSSSSGSYGSSYGSSSSSSSSDKQYGAGGYEMPNESDDSFADYVQRVDPDLYDSINDRYNSAANDYYSSSSGSSGGFVGSDGEYHNYVPEFGDDVNNWMADNW